MRSTSSPFSPARSAREAGIIGPSQTSLTVTVSSALPPSLLAFARIATLAVGVDEAVPGAATRRWALAAVNGPVSLRNEFDAIRELAASLAALQERQRGVIESVLGKGRRVEHGKARHRHAYAAGTCTHIRRPPTGDDHARYMVAAVEVVAQGHIRALGRVQDWLQEQWVALLQHEPPEVLVARRGA